MSTLTSKKIAAALFGILLPTLTGCPPTPPPGAYHGQVLIVNSTGSDMATLTVVGPNITFPKTAGGQAWIRRLPLNVYGPLHFSWTTANGKTLDAIEPLIDFVPEHCNDDLMVEILGPGSMRIIRVTLPDSTEVGRRQ